MALWHHGTKNWSLAACAALALCGCATEEKTADVATTRPDVSGGGLADRIDTAHNGEDWRSRQAVAADITVRFGARPALRGALVYDYHRNLVRIKTDDATLIFDGEKAWVSPASATVPMARFHLLTWPYFLAAPFKLNDPGSHLVPAGSLRMDGEWHDAATLTFSAGTGDSPDDWYLVYADPDTGRLAGMAYIVTYGGKSRQDAEEEPHFIVYEDYVDVDGVLLSTHWNFRLWSEDKGPFGDSIGAVTLSNVRFVETDWRDFQKPEDAKEDALPGVGDG